MALQIQLSGPMEKCEERTSLFNQTDQLNDLVSRCSWLTEWHPGSTETQNWITAFFFIKRVLVLLTQYAYLSQEHICTRNYFWQSCFRSPTIKKSCLALQFRRFSPGLSQPSLVIVTVSIHKISRPRFCFEFAKNFFFPVNVIYIARQTWFLFSTNP
jgi:hypothetical protein